MTDTAQPVPRHLARYARQIQFPGIGLDGQEKLHAARVLIVGCGALGSVIAETLTRAGIGRLRLADRDFVELNNLQRQVLYDEHDVARRLPKAVAAAEKLKAINSAVHFETEVIDVNWRNIERLVEGVDVILDGTDNFETRFLINDISLRHSIPWIYGGCLGATGQTLTIVPPHTPCLRCLYPEPPPAGAGETCDTAGITASIILTIAAVQSLEAIKILAERHDAVSPYLQVFDLWENRCRQIGLQNLAPFENCPCHQGEHPWADGRRAAQDAVLCGRNAVQLRFPNATAVSLDELESKWRPLGNVIRNPFLVRLETDGHQITVFADGRAIVEGTQDPAQAKTLYARFVGN